VTVVWVSSIERNKSRSKPAISREGSLHMRLFASSTALTIYRTVPYKGLVRSKALPSLVRMRINRDFLSLDLGRAAGGACRTYHGHGRDAGGMILMRAHRNVKLSRRRVFSLVFKCCAPREPAPPPIKSRLSSTDVTVVLYRHSAVQPARDGHGQRQLSTNGKVTTGSPAWCFERPMLQNLRARQSAF
jgi:hypothetical protein